MKKQTRVITQLDNALQKCKKELTQEIFAELKNHPTKKDLEAMKDEIKNTIESMLERIEDKILSQQYQHTKQIAALENRVGLR